MICLAQLLSSVNAFEVLLFFIALIVSGDVFH